MNKLLLRSITLAGGLTLLVSGAWAAAPAHAAHGDMSGHGSTAGHAAMAQVDGPLSQEVKASACWIRMLPAPAPSGGFLILSNAGAQDAVVKGASSPDYGMVMVHQTTQDKGMSKMSMVHEITIPAGKELAFEPGGYHVMLERPVHEIVVGQQVQLNLALANGERVSTACAVKPATALKY